MSAPKVSKAPKASKAPRAPAPPDKRALPLAAALHDSVPLARLLHRLQESRSRFEAIRHLIPPPLLPQTRPGPVSDEQWCVLAPNGAVASKLRQLLPSFEAALRAQGWQVSAISIKVQSPARGPAVPPAGRPS